ncbi:MAG TPA: hypothetical protein DDY86_06010 [Syntrophaceae bacterium]|nr:hypothetical protein [Syntrophaceae bacterium]
MQLPIFPLMLCLLCAKYRKRSLVSQANLENRDILFHQASLARLSNIFCPFSLTSPCNFSIYLGAAYLQKEKENHMELKDI